MKMQGYLSLLLLVGSVFSISAHNNKNAQVGRPFTIDLVGNPTTGYTWTATIEDPAIVNQSDHKYKANPLAAGLAGVSGTETLTFIPSAPGQTTLTVEYRRPWEPQDAPEKTKTFLINVQ
jgi:inhibitor of cysteine peptidase